MRFNIYLPKEIRDLLEKQYKEYVKTTPMTGKEECALRKWVKDGHSVYENGCGVWYDGQVPADFLTVYRDEEYIRQHTKGMTPEKTRRFAMAYYGWDDESVDDAIASIDTLVMIDDGSSCSEELPFR